jgi:hypothetical protein
MAHTNRSGPVFTLLAILAFAIPIFGQGERGKAELKSDKGKITVDYGRPQLKGRDPLTWQSAGAHWRMGKDDVTAISLPLDLMFAGTRVPKGTYGLWLLKTDADRYELVFNTDSTGMVMTHDKEKDVAHVSLKKETLTDVVELFTIELKDAPGGGKFAMTWGTARLVADFQFAK